MAKTPDAVANPAGYVQSQRQGADQPPLHHIQPQHFVPIEYEGSMEDAPHNARLTVDLGGEKMRTLVRHVEDENSVVVEIIGVCMSRNHPFKQGDFVRAERWRHMSGRDEWRAGREAVVPAQLEMLQEKRRARLEAEEAQARGKKRRRGEK